MASPVTSSIFFLAFLLLSVTSHGRQILVGGSINSWKVPPSSSSSSTEALNQWAAATRFQVGDSLVWSYDGEKDSVMEVSPEDYNACRTSTPIAAHRGGHSEVRLDRSGAYYFISGTAGSCEKGERVIVVVLSQKHARSTEFFLPPAPAPAPAEIDGEPAAAPAITGAVPRGLVGGGVAAAALLVAGAVMVL